MSEEYLKGDSVPYDGKYACPHCRQQEYFEEDEEFPECSTCCHIYWEPVDEEAAEDEDESSTDPPGNGD